MSGCGRALAGLTLISWPSQDSHALREAKGRRAGDQGRNGLRWRPNMPAF